MSQPRKPSMRAVREAVVAALSDEGVEGAAAALDGAHGDPLEPEDRVRAGDLARAVADRSRQLEQLMGNALAGAFETDGDITLDRATLRALAFPLLAELIAPRRAAAKQLVESYGVIAAKRTGENEATPRLLSRLATEVALMKSAARLAVVQALYQMEAAQQPLPKVREQFESLRIGAEIDGARYREADIDLFRKTLDDAYGNQAKIDQMTDRILVDKWPLARVDATLRALFRAAGAELIAAPKTPPKVVISEYVDVARAFFEDGKEPGMVNAVLDAMARELRPNAF